MLSPAGRVLTVLRRKECGGADDGVVAYLVAAIEFAAHLGFGLVCGLLRTLPHGEIGAASDEQTAHGAVVAWRDAPQADDL